MSREEEKCPVCNKKYYVEIITYPARLDDNRDSYYMCPYCEAKESIRSIYLRGNEDVNVIKCK